MKHFGMPSTRSCLRCLPRVCAGFTGLLIALQLMFAPAGFAQAPEARPGVSDAEQRRAARSLFDAGTIAFRQVRYEDALENFLQAYKLTNDPVLLFNIGLSYERLYRLPEAQKAFEDYLAALPEAKNRAAVEERIRIVEEQIAQTPQPEPAEAPVQPVVEPPPPPPPPPPPVERDKRVLPTWAFYSGLGATAVLGGVTIWSGMDTLSINDDYEKSHSKKLKDEGQSAQLRTNLLIGGTALLAVGTAVVGVFFTDWKGKGQAEAAPQAKLAPWLARSSAGLSVSGSF